MSELEAAGLGVEAVSSWRLPLLSMDDLRPVGRRFGSAGAARSRLERRSPLRRDSDDLPGSDTIRVLVSPWEEPSPVEKQTLIRRAQNSVQRWLAKRDLAGGPLRCDQMTSLTQHLGGMDFWRRLCQHSGSDRYSVNLWESRYLSVWMLTWVGAQRTRWHDHEDSAAGMHVVNGSVIHEYYDHRTHAVRWSIERAGSSFALPAPGLHRVGGSPSFPSEAVSIHAYSGPTGGLDKMTLYRSDEDGGLYLDQRGQPVPVAE